MRTLHAYLLFVATLLTSMGYGATFLLTEHFRALGGSEIETGTTLGGAMLGTLVGVPLVGWFAWRLGAGRMAGLGAMLVACGYLGLASLSALTPLIGVAGFFIGLGWGIFFLAAPMALSMRVADQDRGFWFTRYGAFQMGGIGLSPIVASALISEVGLTTGQAFGAVTLICLLAALLLAVFETIAVRPVAAAIKAAGNAWVRALPALLRTRAIYPILMVGLGACVFSGLLTFQTSLVRGTGLQASTFFAVYAITVVASRFLLAPVIGRARGDQVAVILLAVMIAGVIVAFGLAYGVVVQIGTATSASSGTATPNTAASAFGCFAR